MLCCHVMMDDQGGLDILNVISKKNENSLIAFVLNFFNQC